LIAPLTNPTPILALSSHAEATTCGPCASVPKRRLSDLCDRPRQAQISRRTPHRRRLRRGGGSAFSCHRPPPAICRSGSSTCFK
jgi:hypothetical protein